MSYISLGNLIKSRRKEYKLTQAELGELVAVNASFIGNLERGNRKASFETYIKLSRVLNISMDLMADLFETSGLEWTDPKQRGCMLIQAGLSLIMEEEGD